MFHLILTGVTFLLITHSATANPISDSCDILLSQVDNVFETLVAVIPEMENYAETYASMAGLDIRDHEQVRDVVCKIADATSQKELANALGAPFGQFKMYYAQGQTTWRSMEMIEGLEYMVNTITTVLRALEEAGYPYSWPMTKTYDEWLTEVTQLVDEVGPGFVKWLAPQFLGTSVYVPTVDHPEFLARQLTDATSLSDLARRIDLDPMAVESIFHPFTMAIQLGKVDEAIAFVHAVYDLVEYADSIELFRLPVQ